MSDSDALRVPSTLGEFFEFTERGYRVYDIGRRVSKIAHGQFRDFEYAQVPYPLPLRRSAWLGVVFWPKGSPEDPMIWFLKFPLDERGRLVQAARDYVLQRILEVYGQHVLESVAGAQKANHTQEAAPSVLQDNPFVFRPAHERLAVFRAKLSVELKKEPSRFYWQAREYFCAADATALSWQSLGIQGIADFAARWRAEKALAGAATRIETLASEPFVALCNCFESERISTQVARAVGQRAALAIERGEPGPVLAAAVRGVSYASSAAHTKRVVDLALDSPLAADIEVLAAIAARAWETLRDAVRCARFVDCLARCDAGQEGFDAIVSDLLYMPGLRPVVLGVLRSERRSPLVESRLSALFASLGSETG
jgi:hypothetical protein